MKAQLRDHIGFITILAVVAVVVIVSMLVKAWATGEDATVEIISRTEYIPGDEGQVIGEVRYVISGEPANATCYASAYYPDKTTLFFEQSMTENAIGTHYYNFTVPSIEGVYEYQTKCDIGVKNVTRSKAFHVSGLLREVQRTVNERVEVIAQGVSEARLKETVANTWQLDTPVDLSIGVPMCSVYRVEGLTSILVAGLILDDSFDESEKGFAPVSEAGQCLEYCVGDCADEGYRHYVVDVAMNIEEGSGGLLEDDGGNNVTLYGGYSWTGISPSGLTNAVNFDGSTSYGVLSYLTQVRAARTVTTWFKTTDSSGGYLFGGNGFSTYMNPNGSITYSHYYTTQSNTSGYNDGQWHFLTVIRDWYYWSGSSVDAGQRIYVDGELVANRSGLIGGGGPSSVYMGIGALWNGASASGHLDVDIAQFVMSNGGSTVHYSSNGEIITFNESEAIRNSGGGKEVYVEALCENQQWGVISGRPYITEGCCRSGGGCVACGADDVLQPNNGEVYFDAEGVSADFVLQYSLERVFGNPGSDEMRVTFYKGNFSKMGELIFDPPFQSGGQVWVYENGTAVNISEIGVDPRWESNSQGTWQIVRSGGKINILLNGADNATFGSAPWTLNSSKFPSDDDFVGENLEYVGIYLSGVVFVYYNINDVKFETYVDDNYTVSGGAGTGGPGSNDDKITYYWVADKEKFARGQNYEVRCTAPYSFDSGTTGELAEMSQFVYINEEGKLKMRILT